MKEGHSAAQCTLRSCTRCSKKHNTLVHFEEGSKTKPKVTHQPRSTIVLHEPKDYNTTRSSEEAPQQAHQSSNKNATTLAAQTSKAQRSYVLLSTVVVKLKGNDDTEIECRAILDSGSQLNFITERLAKRLSAKEIVEPLYIQGIGQATHRAQHRVNLSLQSRTTGFSTRIEAFILPQITNIQPSCELDITSWPIPKNIELADPEFHRPSRIDLLIGAENYFQLFSIGQIKLGEGLPTLQNTVLGWVIGGSVQNARAQQSLCGICTEQDEKLNEQMEKFWRLEEYEPSAPKMTASEIKCEAHFNQNVQRIDDGRFMVRLPFQQTPTNLGESKDIALSRFYSLERKLSKNPELKGQYLDFIQEYIKLGHMKQISFHEVPKPSYFLPHHCVIKPESTTTKLRVVFDASAKTSSNIALNDILYTGPTIQNDLFTTLLRFRLPRYVFTADIEKMYRQVLIHPDDRRYQLILWRDEPSERMKCYQLSTVTYGVTTAPYLATKCLQRLANQTTGQYPLGAAALKQNFYVDDVMAGANSLREASEMQEQLNQILKSAGFKLRKWCANHKALLQNIPAPDRAPQLEFHDDNNCHVKTLGLTWLPITDEFCVKTEWTHNEKITKRRVLSDIAHLFDPLGIMSPVVVRAKIFLQKLWSLKLDWDAAVPCELHTTWTNFRKALKGLNDIKIPRHVFSGKIPQMVQLHAFSDASEKAYGAAIYMRSTYQDGIIRVRLLCAKSRVAPTKVITIPRLELCAAKLAADLVHRVKGDLQWSEQCFFWTDSEIVLAWLNSDSPPRHIFEANRVAAIQEVSTADQWRHVPSKENPADLVSRGMSPDKLKSCNLWFYGPIFLHGSESKWPAKATYSHIKLETRQPKLALPAVTSTNHMIECIDHRNSFNHLQRVVAYVLRFIKNLQGPGDQRSKGQLTVEELDEALSQIVKETQRQGFQEDLIQLQRNRYVNVSSALTSLTPFLDNKGIIRVGGRLEEAELPYDTKHPILLPHGHSMTRLLMTHLHQSNSHIGAQALLAKTRQKFWPIKGMPTARSIVQNCVRCSKVKPKLLGQLMGNLPPTRVQPARPFINSGVDFCGPFWTHFKIRGKKPQKSYVAIFCCFATKAVHIEVVSDLTTEAFIAALKRFVSRRGCIRNLYCDNATNFVGANNQLRELQEAIYSRRSETKIIDFCTTRGVDFHFIPPRAPHFGGLWEAAVKSAKHLFKRSVAAASLTYEELETVMTEIEAILNSRPLTPMSVDPNDLSALTPGHFLIGEPLTSSVESHAKPLRCGLLQRWKLVSQLKHEFWQRWSNEYLSELQHRHKWNQIRDNVQPGTMVVIKDENTPVLKWPLGRIIEIIKGKDGLARIADVKTAAGIFRRPIHNLAPLPVDRQEGEDKESPTITNEQATNSHEKGNDRITYNQPRASTSAESNESEFDDQRPPRAKRSRYTNLALTLLLMASLILPILGEEQFATPPGRQFNIKPFATQPGLYFEGLGSTHLVSNEWKLVIYYNMTPYWAELQAIRNSTSMLSRICNLMMEHDSCRNTVSQFHSLINELHNNNELLAVRRTSRHRRAPLNIVGNLANSLFGVLDSEYAEKMSGVIRNLEGNQDHFLELLKNQTSIIDSTANIIQRSHEAVNRQLQEFENHINDSIARINGIQQELHDQKVAELFNALAMRLILTTTNYQRTQSMLLDVIIDTHHGKINPLLIAPRQLQSQIIIIKENLPTTLRLPTNGNDLLELYSLMTVEGRVSSREIIFRLKLPLFSYEPFELLRVVPVPILVNDTFLAIEPTTEFLIVNFHRDQYYPLSDQEMAMCSTVSQTTHMCKQHHPLYRKGSNISTCELSFLNQSPSPTSCKISRMNTAPRWIQLFDPNHWIYIMKTETIINIRCAHTAAQTTLSGSGILTLTSGCTITDEVTTIQAHNLYPSSLRTSFVPNNNITDLLHPVEVAELTFRPLSHLNISDDILRLKKDIELLKKEENIPLRREGDDIHQFSISYIGLVVALAILGYLLIKWCANHCPRYSQQSVPVPAPRTRSSTLQINIQDPEEFIEQPFNAGEDVEN